MGYSSRYHVASLAAVFLALAVGILIGSEVGGDVLSSTRKDLERSLTEDLDQSRAEVRSLRTRLEQADEFGAAILPSLVSDRLEGKRIGLVGFGGLPSEIVDPVEETLSIAGADLVATGAVRQPPDREALAISLEGTGYARLDRSGPALSRYGRAVGLQMVRGGPLLDRTARPSGLCARLAACVSEFLEEPVRREPPLRPVWPRSVTRWASAPVRSTRPWRLATSRSDVFQRCRDFSTSATMRRPPSATSS